MLLMTAVATMLLMSAATPAGAEGYAVFGRVVTRLPHPSFAERSYRFAQPLSSRSQVMPCDVDGDHRFELVIVDLESGNLNTASLAGDRAVLQNHGQVPLPPPGGAAPLAAQLDTGGRCDLLIPATGRELLLVPDIGSGAPTVRVPLPIDMQMITDLRTGYFHRIPYRGDEVIIGAAGMIIAGTFSPERLLEEKVRLTVPDEAMQLLILHHDTGTQYQFADARDPERRRVAGLTPDELKMLAQFPYPNELPAYPIGDFNGDGFKDLLSWAGPIRGWWAAYSNGTVAVERTAPGIRMMPADGVMPLVADFDGNGSDDVATLTADRTAIAVAHSADPTSAHIREVRIVDDERERTVPVNDGHFRAEGLLGGAPALIVRNEHGTARRTLVASAKEIGPILLHAPPPPQSNGSSVAPWGSARGPFVCTGYLSGEDVLDRWDGSFGICPGAHSVIGVDDPTRDGWSKLTSRSAVCCPLPQPDILTGVSVDIPFADHCPPEHIIIGFPHARRPGTGNAAGVRCAKLNTERYRLGARTEGVYWGAGLSARRERGRIGREAIPPPLRHAAGRNGYASWDIDGCIGLPFGSVLIRIEDSLSCSGLTFAEVQYKGAPGDPAAGTPVEMFRPCRVLANPFDPLAGCADDGR